jgi:hypothetical protein
MAPLRSLDVRDSGQPIEEWIHVCEAMPAQVSRFHQRTYAALIEPRAAAEFSFNLQAGYPAHRAGLIQRKRQPLVDSSFHLDRPRKQYVVLEVNVLVQISL